MKKTDAQLVQNLTQSDETAFRELYKRYRDKLWFFCFSFTKSEEKTNDIIQEVFIRLWEYRSFLNPELSFSSFLYTVTKNKILKYMQEEDLQMQIRNALTMQEQVTTESIDEELIYSDYQRILKEAILLLPPRRRAVFELSREENLTHKEIAEKLQISVYTVQEHISEALRFIKTYFAKHTDISLTVLGVYLMV